MKNNIICHIGCMRTASTYLQHLFNDHQEVNQILKSRYFSFDPYFEQGPSFLDEHFNGEKLIIDSDENYSLGRFKSKLISHKDADFSFKNELYHLDHDLDKMAARIHQTYPEGKILMIIRNQKDWIKSVYKHDIQHFSISDNFQKFLLTELGNSYVKAGNFHDLYTRYIHLFGADKVKVMLFEDIRYDETAFFKNLSDFLGVQITPKRNNGKNEAKSDAVINFYRKINKFSQQLKDQPEKRLFYLLRSLLLKSENVVNKFFSKPQLIPAKELDHFYSQYRDSNKELGRILEMEDKMKKYGYF